MDNVHRCISSLEFNLPVSFEWRILASFNHADAVTPHNPFLPIIAQLVSASIELSLAELPNCHVRVELFVAFQLRNCSCNDVVYILKLVPISQRVQEDSAMWEGVHCLEDDIEGSKVIKTFLENVKSLRECWCVNEREAKVNVGLPTSKSRIMLLSYGLNLLIVMLNCKGQGCVVHKLDVVNGLHRRICFNYMDFFYTFPHLYQRILSPSD